MTSFQVQSKSSHHLLQYFKRKYQVLNNYFTNKIQNIFLNWILFVISRILFKTTVRPTQKSISYLFTPVKYWLNHKKPSAMHKRTMRKSEHFNNSDFSTGEKSINNFNWKYTTQKIKASNINRANRIINKRKTNFFIAQLPHTKLD